MKVIVDNGPHEIEIWEARHLTDAEKAGYTPEYHPYLVIGIPGSNTSLEHITRHDLAGLLDRDYLTFPGGSNRAYEITDDEANAFVSLNAYRTRAKAESEKQEEIEWLQTIIAKAEAQTDIPSKAEAIRSRKDWVDLQNESGDGYVPNWVDLEQYESAKTKLAELTKNSETEVSQ